MSYCPPFNIIFLEVDVQSRGQYTLSVDWTERQAVSHWYYLNVLLEICCADRNFRGEST